jgi:hypothetical protein
MTTDFFVIFLLGMMTVNSMVTLVVVWRLQIVTQELKSAVERLAIVEVVRKL